MSISGIRLFIKENYFEWLCSYISFTFCVCITTLLFLLDFKAEMKTRRIVFIE